MNIRNSDNSRLSRQLLLLLSNKNTMKEKIAKRNNEAIFNQNNTDLLELILKIKISN